MPNNKIRVLVVDDSALARKLLANGLTRDPHIEVIGPASDAASAYELLVRERPDVITLDVEMPRMDGVTFLKMYMAQYPTPTVMVSSLTERGKKITLDALEAGAVDIIVKPKLGVVDELPQLMGDLCERVKHAARVDVSRFARQKTGTRKPLMPATMSGNLAHAHALHETTDRVIAIGASAGGVAALGRVIPAFPAASPGIVIVQHMPAGFTTSFAQRLNTISAMQVKEAEDGDRVRPGLVLLAPGGERHMQVYRSGGEYRVKLISAERVSGHCPSVNVLFHSVAVGVGRNAAAALLTGMGDDGAMGLLEIRRAGGRTFAQDEQTSVVFGMPAAAWQKGAAEELVSLDNIPERLLKAIANPLVQ
ncbi:Protein-glutamate methylesterase/protein-glutamine glutaminase of group 2 operon [Anaerolineae bacterium]|nr:Protein-glutamate methylesterase/protein-glutamine glutaminase of group 2 operon [Anaerolineae bacterium]